MATTPSVTVVDQLGVPVGFTGPTRQYRDSIVTAQASGSVTAPGAGVAIASVTIPAVGLWEITATFFLSGTVSAGDANNVQLRQNVAVRLTPIPVPATANLFPPPVVVVLNCVATDTVSLNAVGAGTASAVYNAVVTARQVG